MKVLWLLPHRPRGGAPSGGDLYDAQVVAGLRKLGHRVQVTATLPDPRRVRADVVVQDALGFARFLRFNRALERAGCKARRVALVHVTTAKLSPKSGTAQREAQYLASTHAAVFVSRQARAESLRLLRRATSLQLRSLKTAVIPPGADRLKGQPRVQRMAQQPLRLLCVGHLLPHKGQLALLDAFAAALPTLNATLVLAGSGEIDRRYAAKVRARLRSLPQARCVGALGPAALARALSEADVFINASDYESWGMAAAEAQAAGRPVLSWSSGGLWEFLTPGEDSLRVRAPSLARLATPGLVARLERGARRAARRRRTWKAAARAFADFLSERLEVR